MPRDDRLIRARRSTGFTTAVQPFPAGLYPLLPTKVRKASEALDEARGRLIEAECEATARRVEAEAATGVDKAQARSAVEAGKTPPSSTRAAALDALERAQRAAETTRVLAAEAMRAFVAAVLDNLDELHGNLDARREEVREVLTARLTEMREGIRELQSLSHLAQELGEGELIGHGRDPSFSPIRQQLRRDLAAEAVEPVRAAIEAGGYAPAKGAWRVERAA